MLKITKGNTEKESPDKAIYFDSDESFYDFCLNTEVVPHNEEGSHPCFSLDFTEAYKEALKDEHTYFYIAKRNSTIVRSGCVNYRTITKRVERVIEWGELYNCNILEVPEGVTELRLDKIDIPTLHEFHLPSTLTSLNSDIIEMMEREKYVDRMWGIYVAPGTMAHFKQLLPPSVHHLIKENIKLSDALRNSPMFQLSLSSKELFHSNLLAWLAEDPDTMNLFVEVLKLFRLKEERAIELADGIRNGTYMVLREYKNFDFCICEKLRNWKEDSEKEYVPGQVVLVLENKFKSIPYKAQLEGYEETVCSKLNPEGMKNKVKSEIYQKTGKLINANNKALKNVQDSTLDCHFVLLTLSKDVCGLGVGGNGMFGKWHVVSYQEYAKILLADKTKHFKHDIIRDYAGYVDKFCEYVAKNLEVKTDKPWNKVLCPNKELLSIRMDDIWQKLIANLILSELRQRGKTEKLVANDSEYVVGIKAEDFLKNYQKGDVLVGAGYSRGTALIEIKIHLGSDKNDPWSYGVQIQNGLYKRFLESYNGKVVKDSDEDREIYYKGKLKELASLNLFRYDKGNWFYGGKPCKDEDICPGADKPGKAGMKGFGGYGTTFLAQWKKIEETATVEEVLQQIIDDCKKVKKHPNL